MSSIPVSNSSDVRVDWATHQAAAFACKYWHYSKSLPVPPLVKVGVWEGDEFVGVVIFSRGATQNLLRPYGLTQTEGCELTRIAMREHKTPVSKIVKIAIAFLKRENPGLRLIVSFADPSEGHHGGIYQAGNWIYTGQSAPGVQYRDKDGRLWHPRMITKKGWTVAQGKVRKTLRPDDCQRIDKPGKHRYLMPLDKAMRKQIEKLAKPYPQRVK